MMSKLAPGGRTPIILVVEDDALLRLAVADFLRDAGYSVIEARSAAEAMSSFEQSNEVDLVFSDVQMPGDADGLDLARWLGAHHPNVPVLLTSGIYLSAEEGVIPKPYDLADVEALIGRLLPGP